MYYLNLDNCIIAHLNNKINSFYNIFYIFLNFLWFFMLYFIPNSIKDIHRGILYVDSPFRRLGLKRFKAIDELIRCLFQRLLRMNVKITATAGYCKKKISDKHSSSGFIKGIFCKTGEGIVKANRSKKIKIIRLSLYIALYFQLV